ncbi:MAG: hypothetical protein PHP23_05370 [Desulfobacterales bacterium]|nr:hypothetical protein [Desulfobacterales bacterium]MDD4073559.1 hypothetical protein [Desulfobacterales bacterium]MDD4392027.1 hypothetical protein [Desulfobacterales bacterium]
MMKIEFARYYNKRHNRRGYFGGDRFKSVIVDKGETLVRYSMKKRFCADPCGPFSVPDPVFHQFGHHRLPEVCLQALPEFQAPVSIEK